MSRLIEGLESIKVLFDTKAKQSENAGYWKDFAGIIADAISTITEKTQRIENMETMIEDMEERIAIMTEHGLWIPVEERLPENAQHKGAHCPRYKVYTKWGETEGWYNPDKGCWYFLLWYFAGEKVDFEHGDDPKLAHEINGAKVVTHWMPLSEPPKEGEAE